MVRSFPALALALALFTGFGAAAQAEDDDLVRLPGSGEVKSDGDRAKLKANKLKPGGGLLASFDTDEDGFISSDEFETGIRAAFETADTNEDGELTALEQQAWAANLPTRDDSLANPVRFDPNLDRRVSFKEFRSVILNLGADYVEEGDSVLTVASLKAPEEDKDNGLPDFLDGEFGTRVGSTNY